MFEVIENTNEALVLKLRPRKPEYIARHPFLSDNIVFVNYSKRLKGGQHIITTLDECGNIIAERRVEFPANIQIGSNIELLAFTIEKFCLEHNISLCCFSFDNRNKHSKKVYYQKFIYSDNDL